MNRPRHILAAILAGLTFLAPHGHLLAEESTWKQEFERICIQVEATDDLSDEELHQLIEDSERLLVRLAEVTDPKVKIYKMRLKKCRDFFSFMLEARQVDSPQGEADH
jgi:hypothetical protein